MRRRELSDDVLEASESGPGDVVRLLNEFKPGEYWEREFQISPDATVRMEAYIEILKRSGLDIGKGNTAFGYKMPLPVKDAYRRKLEIFRRH